MHLHNPELALRFARERHEADLRAAANHRLIARRRSDRDPVRRSIGRLIIRIGERLAADPPIELARSR